MPSTTRVALLGILGFGQVHRANLERLGHRVTLVAAADPVAPPPGTLAGTVRYFASAEELLTRVTDLDVVIVATPINTHARLAEQAMRAGADVYLEKPPAASMAEFERLLAAQVETGRVVQVGFQSLGSHAIGALLDGSLDLGEIEAVTASGAWLRRKTYWSRSPWAGKRRVGDEDVVDGVVTNPLAHAVATGLLLAGARTRGEIARVDADLYRANDIEADDTSVVRAVTGSGLVMTAALTLDAPAQSDPFVTVRGSRASARFSYHVDRITLDDGSELQFGRTDLFENLLDHRAHGEPLICPLELTGAFTEVLEEVRLAEVTPIAPEFVDWRDAGDEAHPVVRDVELWMSRATDHLATFSELGAPWARPRPDAVVGSVVVEGRPVADYQDGRSITATSSPRPYLHPVSTIGGVVITDHHPADHDWHFGLSVTLQDVNGFNFWGGRTYLRDRGYIWRNDHGRIESRSTAIYGSTLEDRMTWLAPDGRPVLEESFALAARPCEGGWFFDLSFTLEPVGPEPVLLGSPGSNGRAGGGYGGLSWRLAPCADVRVRTATAEGEDAVHGTVAPWLAWSALFAGGPATIALAAVDHEDPWFVRVAAYPGIGSALAWDRAVVAPVTRAFRGLVADGVLDDAAVAELLA